MVEEQSPIPDQLVRVRGKIALLQVQEKALRDILISDPSTRMGGEYVAQVRDLATYRVSGKTLRKAAPEVFAQFATETVVKQVWLIRKEAADDA